MSESFLILGGNGVFGVHTANHLLSLGKRVICVGRNPEKPSAFTLGVNNYPKYSYYQIHIVHEQDRLFELFDKEKPEVIINFAALAYATSWKDSWKYYDTNVTALARMTEFLTGKDYLKKFIHIGS